MTKPIILITLFTLFGGFVFMMVGALDRTPALIPIGAAIMLTTILTWKRSVHAQHKRPSGGLTGASLIGIAAPLAFLAANFAHEDHCTDLAPGIFILMGLLLPIPAWFGGHLLGKMSTLTFPFPLAFPVSLGLVGLFALLLGPSLMGCLHPTRTFLLLFLGAYVVAWSGMAKAVMKISK